MVHIAQFWVMGHHQRLFINRQRKKDKCPVILTINTGEIVKNIP